MYKEDKLKEECGIFGGFVKNSDIAPYIKKGLFKLQHRGQEAAGLSVGESVQMTCKANGLVMDVLTDDKINSLKGRFGIGHVRYSTQGDTDVLNAQPHHIKFMGESISIAHNGNVKEAQDFKDFFIQNGEILTTSSDSEIILKRLCERMCERLCAGLKKPPSTWQAEEIGKCLNEDFPSGSYCLLLFLPNKIVAIRDSKGFRPMVFCETAAGYFVASEDVAFLSFNPLKTLEIEPGCGVEINENGYKIFSYIEPSDESEYKKCVFEHIYFANPASTVFSKKVYDTRLELGRVLAKGDNVKADVVIPVMDSGFISALGYCFESKIPLQMGLIRNKFVGRSFIAPNRQERIQKVREKLIPVKSVIENKDIVLIDDSLVRGITAKEIISILKDSGAKKVHLRIASPPIINKCFWGVDIPTTTELVCKNSCISVQRDAKGIPPGVSGGNSSDVASSGNSSDGNTENLPPGVSGNDGSDVVSGNDDCDDGYDYEKVRLETGADSLKYLSFGCLKKCFGEVGWCYNCFL